MGLLDTQQQANTSNWMGYVAQAGQGLFGLIGQGIANKQNRRQSNLAYQRAQEMQRQQNLYNNPSSQMERLRAAGLNPNLVYGNGSVANTQSDKPEYKPADIKPVTGGGLSIGSTLAQYAGVQLTRAQTNNVEQDTLNKQIDNANKIITSAILNKQAEKLGIDIEKLRQQVPIETESMQTELAQKKKLFPYQADIQATEKEQSTVELLKMIQSLTQGQENITATQLANKGQIIKNQLGRLDVQGKRTENQIKAQNLIFETYKSTLSKQGVTTSDNLLVRKLVDWLGDQGVDPSTPEGLQKSKPLILRFFEFIDPFEGDPYKK